MGDVKKQIIELLNEMDEQASLSLLDYAEFLLTKSSRRIVVGDQEKEQKLTPLESSRTENESVMSAIKRLRASFFMINTDSMLNETSSLMTQHILQGRDAAEVIDELEVLFDKQYQDYLQS